MKKKMSLMERVKIAERREAEAKRQAERDRKRFMEADLIAKGAMVWVSALARREGPVIHVSAEEIEKARAGKYKCRIPVHPGTYCGLNPVLRSNTSYRLILRHGASTS